MRRILSKFNGEPPAGHQRIFHQAANFENRVEIFRIVRASDGVITGTA